MRATLHLEGTPEFAQASFTFVKPQVLQVVLSFKNGVATEIKEEFGDQGQHYYVNYSSGRASFYVTSKKYGMYVETRPKGTSQSPKLGRRILPSLTHS